MTPNTPKIDISENTLRSRGCVLDILLLDMTKKSDHHNLKNLNIIWATDSYEKKYGKEYASKKQIKREQVTGRNGKLIQPRAAKSKEEQKYRTKDKAEVFTPLKIVKEMNMAINWASKNWPATDENWVDYISELRLEITCGEAPFIVSRYNPVNGSFRPLHRRVGFLDDKLKIVGEFTNKKADWLKYAEVALKSSYGYEWQGDNLLIARENILQSMDDFYKYFCKNKLKLKTKQGLTDEQLDYFAKIVAWNIWQMDGLKCVIPMSCKKKRQPMDNVNKNQASLFPAEKPIKQLIECEGCRINERCKHTGRYVKIMDWEKNKSIRFVDLLNK